MAVEWPGTTYPLTNCNIICENLSRTEGVPDSRIQTSRMVANVTGESLRLQK